MTVIPAICRYVGRYIPAASAVVRNKNFAPGYSAQQRCETAGCNVLLVTMDNVSAPNFIDDVPGERVRPLLAKVVRFSGDSNPQIAQHFLARIVAKTQE